eukprot:scaffold88036_cov61-Phaeocystis_antarctica.AAC.3
MSLRDVRSLRLVDVVESPPVYLWMSHVNVFLSAPRDRRHELTKNLDKKNPCNANGSNGFMEPRYRDAGVRGAWSASRHGRLPLIVDVDGLSTIDTALPW